MYPYNYQVATIKSRLQERPLGDLYTVPGKLVIVDVDEKNRYDVAIMLASEKRASGVTHIYSYHFSSRSLLSCVDMVHKDIIIIWNLPDMTEMVYNFIGAMGSMVDIPDEYDDKVKRESVFSTAAATLVIDITDYRKYDKNEVNPLLEAINCALMSSYIKVIILKDADIKLSKLDCDKKLVKAVQVKDEWRTNYLDREVKIKLIKYLDYNNLISRSCLRYDRSDIIDFIKDIGMFYLGDIDCMFLKPNKGNAGIVRSMNVRQCK